MPVSSGLLDFTSVCDDMDLVIFATDNAYILTTTYRGSRHRQKL